MVETENVVFITLFAFLVFFTVMTGLVVYTVCGRKSNASYQPQSRPWTSLISILVLTLVRLEETEDKMAKLEEDRSFLQTCLNKQEIELPNIGEKTNLSPIV